MIVANHRKILTQTFLFRKCKELHKKYLLLLFALFFPLFLWSNPEEGNKAKKLIYFFSIEEEIAPPATMKTEKALKEAGELQADIIIMQLNTFGGTLDDADKISTMLLSCPIPVWAFINNNAASAGALISIACDSIYMHSGSRIGAATVVNQNGEVQPDKYQSYMRTMMRSAAEVTGRDPDIAQAMVDPTIHIAGIVDSGKVLTFTTSEAIAHGFCEAQAENVKEVLQKANIENYEIKEQKLTVIDKIIRFLTHPAVGGILILVIVAGIYFELQTPGVGFPLIIASIAAVLYFAPFYLEGLAANWEILLFIIGIGLLALEIFVIPGFGVAGISGIVCVVLGLTLSMLGNNGLDFSAVSSQEFIIRFSVVMIALVLSVFGIIFLSQKIISHNTFGEIALDTVQKASEGYTVAQKEEQSLVGQRGIAATILRPSGKVQIGNTVYDARSFHAYIEKGEQIEVMKYENTNLVVKKVGSEV